MKPIGIFHCSQKTPAESPRQGSLAVEATGFLELNPEMPMETLKDIEGFSHLWLVYQFHQNSDWKPLVQPPRGSEKRGVFATRSPYRPNAIGISCVRLEKIEAKKLLVSHHDLLDKTPIYDIKPYIAYADAVPEAKTGWLNGFTEYKVHFSDLACQQISWLQERLGNNLTEIVKNQLSFEPTNSKKKRVRKYKENWVFAYKTWRLLFSIEDRNISVLRLESGYSQSEIIDQSDPYGDKELHRKFIKKFD